LIELWPHQLRGLEGLREGFTAGHRHGLIVIPTGGGKTICSLAMLDGAIRKGKRALFVADRRVLVSQAARAADSVGVPCGVVMRDAGYGWADRSAPLQVVSKDSLVSWLKRPDFELPPADLIVVDEAHKSIAETWAVLRAAYPNAWEVGLTATPARADGKGLGRRYQFLVQPTTYAELQELGVLVRPECFEPPAKQKVGSKARKPTKSTLTGDAVAQWQAHADGLRTFVFCSGVDHSLAVRDQYRAAGVKAEHVDASTPDDERDRILKALAAGDVQVVTNCAVLRYGVDVPAVECCQILCGMGSVVDYRQSVGRVLRKSPGKARAVVLDHAGAVRYHGFPDADLPWTLDDAEDQGEKQRKRMEKGEAPQPVGCPSCGALFAGRTCPACGWEPKRKANNAGTDAGMLVKADRSAHPADLAFADLNRLWRRALAIAANRGMKVQAAASIFFKDAKRWPEAAGVDPLPATRADWSRPAAEVFPQFVRGGKVEV
jgi:DNA repair protein RadD